MNDYQIQQIMTQPLAQFANADYIPQSIMMQPITPNQQLQQMVPVIANMVIQGLQAGLQSSPNHYTMATFNILANNGYDNMEFRAVVKILLTACYNYSMVDQNIANNFAAYLPNMVSEFLPGAIALMFQKYSNILCRMGMDIQQRVQANATKISQVLNSQQQQQPQFQPGIGGNILSGLMDGLQSNQRVGAIGSQEQSIFNKAQTTAPTQTGTHQYSGDNFYTKKLQKLKSGEVQDTPSITHVEAFSTTPAPEDKKVKSKIPDSISVLSGEPGGMVIVSKKSNLGLNQPVTEEVTHLFKSSMVEEDSEPVWDVPVTDSDKLDNKPTAQSVISLCGFPGIRKDGGVMFKPDIKSAMLSDNLAEHLANIKGYTIDEMRMLGMHWYPSIVQPTVPDYDPNTQAMLYFPILENNGLFAFHIKKEDLGKHSAFHRHTTIAENMDYEQHGIGFVPKMKNPPVRETADQKPTDKSDPKPFKLVVEVDESVSVDFSQTPIYRSMVLKLTKGAKQETYSKVAMIQPALIVSTFSFDSTDEKEKAKAHIDQMSTECSSIDDVVAVLDQMDEAFLIPVKQRLSSLFAKQISRAITLKAGISMEFDCLTAEGWSTIKQYIDSTFFDGLKQSFYSDQRQIIEEVMSGERAFMFQDMKDLIDVRNDLDEEQSRLCLDFGTYEQVIVTGMLACELELKDNREQFMIPESATKIYSLAKEVLKHSADYGYKPASSVIITRDGFRIDVDYNYINGVIVGSVSEIA